MLQFSNGNFNALEMFEAKAIISISTQTVLGFERGY